MLVTSFMLNLALTGDLHLCYYLFGISQRAGYAQLAVPFIVILLNNP